MLGFNRMRSCPVFSKNASPHTVRWFINHKCFDSFGESSGRKELQELMFTFAINPIPESRPSDFIEQLPVETMVKCIGSVHFA